MLLKELRLLPKPEVVGPWDHEAFRRSHHRALIETQLRLYLTHAYAYYRCARRLRRPGGQYELLTGIEGASSRPVRRIVLMGA